MSVFLAGGGLKMWQVVGATNPRGEEPVRRRRAPEFHDLNGRPFPILKNGEPIAELL